MQMAGWLAEASSTFSAEPDWDSPKDTGIFASICQLAPSSASHGASWIQSRGFICPGAVDSDGEQAQGGDVEEGHSLLLSRYPTRSHFAYKTNTEKSQD